MAFAQAEETLLPINVETLEEKGPKQVKSSLVRDTAEMLKMEPGISFQTGGGISSLPIIHGMADDRVKVSIDGAQVTSSCPNHMNPALSYVDPEKVSAIEVFAGITPVGQGGDSLGGSVVVKTKGPTFAKTPEKNLQDLKVKSFFRTNNENSGQSLFYSWASMKHYVRYEGLDERANNYRTGKGKRLKSTLYNRNNQSLTLGHQLKDGVLTFKWVHTIVPYEGFINQRMDMENNVSNQLIANYKGSLKDLFLEASAYHQHTNHYMNKISSERAGSMPMVTRSNESGYNLKFFTDFSRDHLLSFGSDFNRYRLNDYWPPLPGVTDIMGPGTFQSINDGERDRFGLFVENDSQWSSTFSTNLGVRTDLVRMNTGDVRGYNETDNLPADANRFNGVAHRKTDQNLDMTLTSKTLINPKFDVEFGLGRKTRSPNLYERYAWAGSVTDPTDPSDMSSMGAAMDMLMINWFGDGNGYVGNLDLKPEVAHKVSSSFVLHDEGKKEWEVRLTPYFSQINNFIDADYLGTSMGANFLKFANHDAILFGGDFSARSKIKEGTSLRLIASYTRGYRKDGKANLYHLMPLNGKILLEHTHRKWSGDFLVHLVNKKKQVNELRNEPPTPGHALLDVGVNYEFSKLLKLNLGVSNLLNQPYALPLGGVDLVNYSVSSRTPVAGMGRSYNLRFNFDFF